MTLTLSYHRHPWQFYYQTLWLSIIAMTIKSCKSGYPPQRFSSAVQLLARHLHMGCPQIHTPEPVLANLNRPFSAPQAPSTAEAPSLCERTSLLSDRELLQWLALLCSLNSYSASSVVSFLFLFRFDCHSQEQVLVYQRH